MLASFMSILVNIVNICESIARTNTHTHKKKKTVSIDMNGDKEKLSSSCNAFHHGFITPSWTLETKIHRLRKKKRKARQAQILRKN